MPARWSAHFKLCILVVLGIAAVVGVSTYRAGQAAREAEVKQLEGAKAGADWVQIAVIDPNDDGTVRDALLGFGIESSSEGSTVLKLVVHPADATEAIEMLKKDSREKGYWIRFFPPRS